MAGEATAQQRTSCLLFRLAPYVAAAGQWINVENAHLVSLFRIATNRREAILKSYGTGLPGSSERDEPLRN
jgi:hypothetical protein